MWILNRCRWMGSQITEGFSTKKTTFAFERISDPTVTFNERNRSIITESFRGMHSHGYRRLGAILFCLRAAGPDVCIHLYLEMRADVHKCLPTLLYVTSWPGRSSLIKIRWRLFIFQRAQSSQMASAPAEHTRRLTGHKKIPTQRAGTICENRLRSSWFCGKFRRRTVTSVTHCMSSYLSHCREPQEPDDWVKLQYIQLAHSTT